MKKLKNADNFKNRQVNLIDICDTSYVGKFIAYKSKFENECNYDSVCIEINPNYSIEITIDEIKSITIIGNTYTLEDIIINYSKKDLVILTKDGYSINGRINGYEREGDSEVGDDVIFFGREYLNYGYQIKVSDIVDIEFLK